MLWHWLQADRSDAVYIGDKDGYLYALDASTGTTKWKTGTIKEDGYPYVGHDGYIYVTSDTGVQALHAKDGSASDKAVTLDVVDKSRPRVSGWLIQYYRQEPDKSPVF